MRREIRRWVESKQETQTGRQAGVCDWKSEGEGKGESPKQTKLVGLCVVWLGKIYFLLLFPQ